MILQLDYGVLLAEIEQDRLRRPPGRLAVAAAVSTPIFRLSLSLSIICSPILLGFAADFYENLVGQERREETGRAWTVRAAFPDYAKLEGRSGLEGPHLKWWEKCILYLVVRARKWSKFYIPQHYLLVLV